VTDKFAIIEIVGTKSNTIIDSLLDKKSQTDWKDGFSKVINIKGAPVRIVKSNLYKIPSWQIHVQSKSATKIFDFIMNIGIKSKFTVKLVGYSCLEFLRITRGYPKCGIDYSNKDVPMEVGKLSYLSTTHAYVGQASLQKNQIFKKYVRIRPKSKGEEIIGNEIIYRNDKESGLVTSGALTTLMDSVGIGFITSDDTPLTPDYLKSGKYQVLIKGKKVDCIVDFVNI